MFFEREALEQASGFLIASYRAERFDTSRLIFDLGCGLGGDTLALAQKAEVIAVDIDRLRLELLGANAAALGLTERIHRTQADLRRLAWRFPSGALAFFDPARRRGGKRRRSVQDYEPPLAAVTRWLPRLPGLAVKVGPAIDLAEVQDLACEVEFISQAGELKEAVLWFGELRTTCRRATVLPGAHTLLADSNEPAIEISEPKDFIYEPDPAVMRAGLVRHLGVLLQASQLDPTLAFLTSEERRSTPFARCYRVVEILPFSLKRLRGALRARMVGRVTLKKRGSAVDVSALQRRLRPKGPNEAIVILTRIQGKPTAMLVEVQAPPDHGWAANPGQAIAGSAGCVDV